MARPCPENERERTHQAEAERGTRPPGLGCSASPSSFGRRPSRRRPKPPTIPPRRRRLATAATRLHAAIGLYRPAADKGERRQALRCSRPCADRPDLYTARLRTTSVKGRSSMPPPPRCCRVLLPSRLCRLEAFLQPLHGLSVARKHQSLLFAKVSFSPDCLEPHLG